jgi:hypothetical protein
MQNGKNMHRYKMQGNTNYGRNTNYQNPISRPLGMEIYTSN